jgi:hypothetical protein
MSFRWLSTDPKELRETCRHVFNIPLVDRIACVKPPMMLIDDVPLGQQMGH